MNLERGKKDWKGPLADACKGMSKEFIAAAMGCTTVTVSNYMTDVDKQRSIPLNMVAGLHRAASPRAKARIEKFINDQLVA